MNELLIYRREALLQKLGVSKSTLRNWMLTQGFPCPIQLGPRAVGWVASQVHAWLEQRPTITPAEQKDD
ncbi:helix-turn-helix transcriptional regulator [Comamonas kerstersii]|uniref:helix-turn-helix transcriptional regulator n=1 Tax=Comamonas kerstersii TaxID=225992 RepID=UPI003EE023E5